MIFSQKLRRRPPAVAGGPSFRRIGPPRLAAVFRPLVAGILAGLLAGALAAQTAAPKELNLLIGRGELLQFDRDVIKVVVAEPKTADVVVVSPREVMVNAKGA